MKNNQFALLPVDSSQVLAELKLTKFVDEHVLAATTIPHAFQLLLEKTFPEVEDQSALNTKLSTLLATPKCDVYTWITSAKLITADVFYRIALQLLEFLPEVDFDIDNPLAAMDKMHLPTVQTNQFDRETLYEAWYLLLNTHTKNGKSLLDRLATRGYFQPFMYEADTPRPLFFNGKAQPVFDTRNLLHEVVYIETDFDTDNDGQRDLVKAEIVRPIDADLQVPVLFTASPYNQGTNDEHGEKLTHNVNVPLTHKKPTELAYTTIEHHANLETTIAPREIAAEVDTATETFAREQSYTLNDYFLARGYAVIYSAGIGSKDSEGLQTTGDEYEVASAKAVVEWVHGDRVAFTNKTDNLAIKATWSNGKVAMTGRSYLGTLATAVATTGVAGLETIVSEAAISSWYDYYRSNGLVIAPGGYPGEDADVLAEETFSRRKQPGDFYRIKDQYQAYLDQMGIDQDRDTGSYNAFWDARNYLKDVANIKADIIMVHGLNDWNVKPEQVNNLWHALDAAPVNKKIILHQGEHIYINAMRSIDFTDMMNLWFAHKLYGLDNHAPELLPNVLIQDNVTPETWHAEKDWDAVTDKKILYLNNGQLSNTAGDRKISFMDQVGEEAFKAYTNDIAAWDHLLKAPKSALSTNRALFQTVPLERAEIIDGRVTVKLRLKSSVNFGMISCQLVDYGDAKRFNIKPTPLGVKLDSGFQWREDTLNEFTLASKATPFKMISKGHINLQNRTNAWQADELRADQYVDVELALQPTYYHLPAGHQLGLVVYATDYGMTVRGNQDITYTIDESASQISIPFIP
ncbi:Xaa-Pro dipeptidyl-peptidase [Periweissella fabaria]|uniref:Xaa-Pro dipeptidyl-peptidase n=1 Tax=Periweissella fabaria TaxID=546157 RepID=A0ABM8Z5U1_9LACO|nr:Xaa-Pro dipeptidyl-peptidase [Periweissella fabaria]MCM0597545.1 Xaa-Pro dipeptidyl-peptidase [Periweissella fabaria]CAH0416728.1 Xaa-Pro dipeptidyl-peptidase [Periweissella fabaria]